MNLRSLPTLLLVIPLSRCVTAPARCATTDFSIGSSYMTATVRSPIVVAELKGQFVLDSAGLPRGAHWNDPADRFRFQMNGPNGLSFEVPVDSDGSFYAPGLRPGRYCFQTSSQHFQGYTGVVVIDPRASREPVIVQVYLDN